MTHRERAVLALEGRQPDFVPHFEIEFQETARDFEGRLLYGRDFELDRTGLTPREMNLHNARLRVDIARKFDHSMIVSTFTPNCPGRSFDEESSEQIAMIRDLVGSEFMVLGGGDPTYAIPGTDMMEFVENLYDDPQGMKDEAQRRVDAALRSFESYRDAGADGFVLWSDYAFNPGPFLSPDMFAEFITPYLKQTIEDPHGWQECADGTWFFGLHILSGRIKDIPGWPMKTALREIAAIHTGDFRLTPSQNLSISGVTPEQKPVIEGILAKHGLTGENNRSGLRLNALSCVALPTCGLALPESERILPDILEKFETVLDAAGLRDDAISLRVTGCPNGCARPYLAEIGFVGRAPNKYALYLGASYNGTRLNRLVTPSITIDDAVTLLEPVIKRYAVERAEGEGFGDFCDRVILPKDATFHSVGTDPLTLPAAVGV